MAQISNSASVAYNYGESGTGSATSNTAVATLLEDYSISVNKYSLEDNFRPGENITYFVQITNEGTLPLYNITISDDLAGTAVPLEYVSGTLNLLSDGGITAYTPSSTKPLTWTYSNALASGETITFAYVARVDTSVSSETTSVTNTATVTAYSSTETATAESVTGTANLTLALEDYASLEITKSVSSSEISEGTAFSYTLTIANNGNADATGVVITDVLPAGFTISSITSTVDGSTTTYGTGDYTVDSATNTLTLPTGSATLTVPAGDEAVVTITGTFSSA